MINEKAIKANLKEYPQFIIEKVTNIAFEIQDCNSTYFDERSLRTFCLDIAKALTDRTPVEFVITTCPGYSYNKETGEFTFKEVLGEIGLVGIKAVEGLLPVLGILNRYNVFTNVTFAYADLEAVDEDILESLNISSSKFQELIEQSIAHAYLYLKRLLRECNYDNFIVADSLRMSERFLTTEVLDAAKEEVNAIDDHRLNTIAVNRTGVVDRMFKNSTAKNSSYSTFLEKRTRKDIQDHIALGEAARNERNNGRQTSIVTLSIPHLSQFFNYKNSEDHVPVIRIQQNY